MGFVGAFSYLAAATQDLVSASLISEGVQVVEGARQYNFDLAVLFWIGSSVLSMLLAASLWNTKIRD
jgi:OPA family sugar phosphate sensor protein UhpC-like MFS transporter